MQVTRVPQGIPSYYAPGLQDTTDLEAATKTITAEAEAAGVGNADYSAALTLGVPSDGHFSIQTIGTRLAATIDSISTGANLRCRVYVDAQDANHLLFDETWATIGAKLAALDLNTSVKPTINTLLINGAAHTFHFFFWKDATGVGDTVISLVEVWDCVGSCATGVTGVLIFNRNVPWSGMVRINRVGSGTCKVRLNGGGQAADLGGEASAAGQVEDQYTGIVGNANKLSIYGSGATDLNYLVFVQAFFELT